MFLIVALGPDANVAAGACDNAVICAGACFANALVGYSFRSHVSNRVAVFLSASC